MKNKKYGGMIIFNLTESIFAALILSDISPTYLAASLEISALLWPAICLIEC